MGTTAPPSPMPTLTSPLRDGGSGAHGRWLLAVSAQTLAVVLLDAAGSAAGAAAHAAVRPGGGTCLVRGAAAGAGGWRSYDRRRGRSVASRMDLYINKIAAF